MISLAALVLVPATAQASWLEPAFLSAAGSDANAPHVAMDRDGDALAVWSRVDGGFNRIQARPRSAAGIWGAVSTLSLPGQHATTPRVALDQDGDALIVWIRSDGTNVRVQSRKRSRTTGVLGPLESLSVGGEDAQEPMVAIDDDGDAIVTWYRSDGANQRVQARVRSVAGTWGPVIDLSAAGTDASGPRVAIDDGGDGIAVWHRSDGSLNQVFYRVRPAGGTWGPITLASRANLEASNPTVDMDEDGDALIAWQGQDANALQRIEARHRSSTGTVSPIQTLSDVTAADAHVAMSPGGTATVVWRRDPGLISLIEARLRMPTAGWGPVRRLSDTPGSAFEPRVAAGTVGATAVWRREDGDGNWRVESRPWLPSAWRPFTVLSADDRDADLPQVAMEEVGGEAIAVWRSTDGANFRIEGSAGP